MVNLTKHKTVMQRESLPHFGRVIFSSVDEDTDDVFEVFEMDEYLWHGFGEPDVITLTVEPGDKLNG